jgi:polysaccharide export outer membrane protein
VASLSACSKRSDVKEWTQPVNGYALGPEDVLEVTVWRNQDLSRQVVIRPDGMISMPLIGDVRASGLMANELAQRISERLKEFKESPVVSVAVKEVNSYNIYVLGEVTRPGKYQVKTHTTVLQAIAIAGGFTIHASKNSMRVVRKSVNEDGQVRDVRTPVRYQDLISGEGDLGDFVLRPGDRVVVP